MTNTEVPSKNCAFPLASLLGVQEILKRNDSEASQRTLDVLTRLSLKKITF